MGRPRGAGRVARDAAQDPQAFARLSGELEAAIERSCEPDRPWPARIAAAIRAALAFAAADPIAARAITVHSAFRRLDAAPAFTELVERLAARLRDGAPRTQHPERTARNVVLRVARQTLLQLEQRPGSPPQEIAPELIVFALIPYIGLVEAQRWAETP